MNTLSELKYGYSVLISYLIKSTQASAKEGATWTQNTDVYRVLKGLTVLGEGKNRVSHVLSIDQ